ncbi:MAG: DUF4142 domain-containing protein [Gemmatimonadales bacterium]
MIALLMAAMLMPGIAPIHAGAARATRQPTDGQILGVLGELHANAVEAAKVAAKKASSGAVKDYAKVLLDDHQQAEDDLLELAKRHHIAPQVPSDSTVRHTHDVVMTQLNLATGAAFDKAFMQYMLVDQEAAVNAIRKTLLPATHNRDVRKMIRKLLPVLERHVATAQQWIDRNS